MHALEAPALATRPALRGDFFEETLPERCGAAAGFSLLEMLVVLAILAVAAAVALPRIGRTPVSLTLKAAAVEMQASLASARAQSLRDNRDATVRIDVAQRRYFPDRSERGAVLARDIAIDVSVPAQNVSSAGDALFRFRPDGSSTGGRIRLASGGRAALISVDWMTGFADVSWEP